MAELDIVLRARDLTARGVQAAERRLDGLRGATRKVGEEGDRSSGKLQQLTATIRRFGPAARTAALAGVAAIAAVGAAAVGRATEIERLSKIARTGAEDFQRLEYQVAQTGGEGEDLADVLREMTLRLAEAESLASGPAVDALRLLGISLEDLEGVPAPERLALLRDRISEVEDPSQRLFLAEELLGGSVERLSGFMELTTAEAGKLREESEGLNIAQQENITTVNDFIRDLKSLANEVLAGVINFLGEAIRAVDGFFEALKRIKDTIFGGSDSVVNDLENLNVGLKETRDGADDAGGSVETASDGLNTFRESAVKLGRILPHTDELMQEFDLHVQSLGGSLAGIPEEAEKASASVIAVGAATSIARLLADPSGDPIGALAGIEAIRSQAIAAIRDIAAEDALINRIASSIEDEALGAFSGSGGYSQKFSPRPAPARGGGGGGDIPEIEKVEDEVVEVDDFLTAKERAVEIATGSSVETIYIQAAAGAADPANPFQSACEDAVRLMDNARRAIAAADTAEELTAASRLADKAIELLRRAATASQRHYGSSAAGGGGGASGGSGGGGQATFYGGGGINELGIARRYAYQQSGASSYSEYIQEERSRRTAAGQNLLDYYGLSSTGASYDTFQIAQGGQTTTYGVNQSTGQSIIIQVDGQVLGEAVVKATNAGIQRGEVNVNG